MPLGKNTPYDITGIRKSSAYSPKAIIQFLFLPEAENKK
jgi:hypothetical protein